MENINESYIAGFVDGEGCFALSLRRDVRHERPSKAVYYGWKASFVICLRADDDKILKKIKAKLDCGSITYPTKSNQVRYQISNLDSLMNIIIPFFNRNEIIGKKGRDFRLWEKAVQILFKYKNLRSLPGIAVAWTKEDLNEIKNLHTAMKEYKSMRGFYKWNSTYVGRELED